MMERLLNQYKSIKITEPNKIYLIYIAVQLVLNSLISFNKSLDIKNI